MNVGPKLMQTPGEVRWLGRHQVGADTNTVLRGAWFGPAIVQRFADEEAIRR